jgi:hypothetical protein
MAAMNTAVSTQHTKLVLPREQPLLQKEEGPL